jgi:hypothetical protein
MDIYTLRVSAQDRSKTSLFSIAQGNIDNALRSSRPLGSETLMYRFLISLELPGTLFRATFVPDP